MQFKSQLKTDTSWSQIDVEGAPHRPHFKKI